MRHKMSTRAKRLTSIETRVKMSARTSNTRFGRGSADSGERRPLPLREELLSEVADSSPSVLSSPESPSSGTLSLKDTAESKE